MRPPREQYADLAPERAKAGKCAMLLYTLCGLRTAASTWEREYSQTLEAEGLVPGIASKCTFVHGDDFVIEGGKEDLDWTKGVLANKYLVKVRSILGPERQDDKVADILNRVMEWRALVGGRSAACREDAGGHRAGGLQAVGGARSQAGGGAGRRAGTRPGDRLEVPVHRRKG